MSPRKKQACVLSPGVPQLPSSSNTIALDLPDGAVDRANANHHVRLSVVLAVLNASDLLAEISSDNPLNIAANGSAEASGLQAPFSQGSYEASMSKNSEYTVGINIFWHDWNYTATPGIPFRSNAIDTLMEHYFQTPARFPGNVVHLGTFAHVRTVGTQRGLAIGIARRDTCSLLACFRA